MTRASDLFTSDEIRVLTQTSDAQGALAVITDWALIAASLALVGWWLHPVTVFVAVWVIGGRQLGLAVLAHECAHRSLFRTRRLNDFVGTWIVGGPVWVDVHRYRTHHLGHHTRTGTDEDPDLGLVTPFPTTLAGLARKFLRDLSGAAGVRRLAAQVLMDLGYLSYSASVGQQWQDPGTKREVLRRGVARMGPVVLTNALGLALLWAVGLPWLYLLWVVAYLTTFSLVLRIRSIAEHAMTERSADPLGNTRTTRAGPLARLLWAPHRVNFHLEHHLLMTVPYFRLPAAHVLLRDRRVFDETNSAGGYLEVLALASSK